MCNSCFRYKAIFNNYITRLEFLKKVNGWIGVFTHTTLRYVSDNYCDVASLCRTAVNYTTLNKHRC